MSETPKSVARRMQSCTGPDAIAAEALAILIEASGASGGHLFCRSKGRLELVASSEAVRDPQALRAEVEAFMQKELANEMVATALEAASLPPSPPTRGSGNQREFEPLVLQGKHAGQAVIAGVAGLYYPGSGRPALRRSTLEAVTQALIEMQLAEPLACVS